MVYELKSRNVLITGGSRGLGAATAARFAMHGANIAINYVAPTSASIAKDLAAQLSSDHGVKCVTIQADVAEESQCRRLVQEAIKGLGGLDIIISNAGWTKITEFSDIDALSGADWDRCWATNTKATLHLLQEALPTFRANADGGVLLISSSAAATNATGSSMAYTVSKAAGLHLMRCLAATQGPKVRVNAVQPGLLMTEWGMSFPEEKVAGVMRMSKLGKLGSVEDTADAFVYLARADTVTGASLKIDGGAFEH